MQSFVSYLKMQNVKLLKRGIFSAGWTDVTHSLMAFGGVIDSTPIYLSAFCCARETEREQVPQSTMDRWLQRKKKKVGPSACPTRKCRS